MRIFLSIQIPTRGGPAQTEGQEQLPAPVPRHPEAFGRHGLPGGAAGPGAPLQQRGLRVEQAHVSLPGAGRRPARLSLRVSLKALEGLDRLSLGLGLESLDRY